MTTMIPEIVCSLQKQQSSSEEYSPCPSPFSTASSDDELDFPAEGCRQLHSPPCPAHQQLQHHVNLQDKSGKSLLIHACARGLQTTVEELSLDQNIEVNLEDVEGNTALIHAAQAGHAQIVELLIGRFAGLEIDHVNKLGQTALIKAAIQGRTNCARILLKAGADPYRKDNGRQLTALEWAEFVGRVECGKVIAEFVEPKRRGKKSMQHAQDNFKQVACLAAIPLIGGEVCDVPTLSRPRVRSAPPTPTVKIKITPPSSPFWNVLPPADGQQQPFTFSRTAANSYYRAVIRSSSKNRPLQKYERPKSSAS